MWKQLTALWNAFKRDAQQMWFALEHPDAPTWFKAGAAGLVVYVVSPIDLVPDMLPVMGVVDDLIVVPMAMRWLLRQLPPHIRQYAQERSRGGSGTRKNPTRSRR